MRYRGAGQPALHRLLPGDEPVLLALPFLDSHNIFDAAQTLSDP